MPCLIPENAGALQRAPVQCKLWRKDPTKNIVNGCGGSDFPINICIEEILHTLVEGLHCNTGRQLEFVACQFMIKACTKDQQPYPSNTLYCFCCGLKTD